MASKLTTLGNELYSGSRSINVYRLRRIFYALSALILVVAALLTGLRGGFQFGLEFTGGVQYTLKNVDPALAADTTRPVALVQRYAPGIQPVVTTIGSRGVEIRLNALTGDNESANRTELGNDLTRLYNAQEKNLDFSYIGPTWGADISSAAIRGLIIFIALVALVMAVYFRTWKMSLAGLVSLAHDILLTAAVFGAVGFEVTPASVIGLLTILGYSLYDTVVVFDKIRENTQKGDQQRTFAELVTLSVNQTLIRSINTSIVGLLPVAAILFIGTTVLGGGTLRDISLSLFVGILVGTYSTIFIAAPLYAALRSREPATRVADQKVTTERARREASSKASVDAAI